MFVIQTHKLCDIDYFRLEITNHRYLIAHGTSPQALIHCQHMLEPIGSHVGSVLVCGLCDSFHTQTPQLQ